MQALKSKAFLVGQILFIPPQMGIIFAALLLVCAIGWMDWLIGWEYSLFVFYSVPITWVVWKTDRGLGFAFSLLCTTIWWGVTIGHNPYQSDLGFAIALVGRLFYFMILVVAVSAIKNQRALDLARIESLEREQKLEQEILWTKVSITK